MLPAFSCISWAYAFRAGDDESIFFSGPVEAEDGTYVAAPAVCLFWNLMAHPLLCEEDSSSPPRWLWTAARIVVHEESESPPKILGEAARACTMTPLFMLPFTLLVVLTSSSSGDQHF
jgi:hypothetical protein